MERSNQFLGWLFLLLGIVFTLDNFNVVTLNWSLYIVLTGLLLLMGFVFNRELTVFLLPGTMLLIYGLLFVYCSLSGWQAMNVLWPMFFVAPGVGFFLLYFFKQREIYYWLPGTLFLVFGLLFFLRKVSFVRYWPLLLIVLGGVLLYRFYKTKR